MTATVKPDNEDDKLIFVDFKKGVKVEDAPKYTTYSWRCSCCDMPFVYDSREDTNKSHVTLFAGSKKKEAVRLCCDCAADVAKMAVEEGWVK